MYFLRLPDPLMTVLFENDEIIAIDKPYGINAHTNDSKVHHQDFIQDGLIEVYEKQLGIKLSIVHRLDQTTTGVIIFAKSQESAKKYAEYFFHRQVQKTYVFVTAATSKQSTFHIDKVIIHKAKELESETDFKFLKKNSKFELWEAYPHTGRNHQIRIHAEAAGIPLLGDALYHGHDYPFLCLHNRKIEFPNGVIIESKLPKYFQDIQILNDEMLAKAFFEIDRRERLFAIDKNFQAPCRLIQNKNETEEVNYSLDLVGNNLVLQWYSDNFNEKDLNRFNKIAISLQRPLIVKQVNSLKVKELNQILNFTVKNPEPLQKWTISESKMNFEIRTDSGSSLGYFPEQRLQRQWIFENSKGKNVLNIFANTCTSSVAAALGEALKVTSIESNKSLINWGRDNFTINDIDVNSHLFFCRDIFLFLDQSISKNQLFDILICEAPAFYRGEKGIFKIEKDLEKLIEKCFLCLKDDGSVLFSTSTDVLDIVDIKDKFLAVQKKLKINKLEIYSIQSSFDFELPVKKSSLKSFLIHKNSSDQIS